MSNLLPADSPRTDGEDPQHTQVLASSGAVLPPIIVHRASMRVVDGMHRLRAAVARGESRIRVRFFDGPLRDVFLIAVRENIMHGLPLSLSDRTAAASRIIETHGHWSNRAIAETTGLSARTVSQIRRVIQVGNEQTTRLGRDGRTRPLDSSQGRVLAAQLVAEMPTASLRQIARLAGISPGTVRDVRTRVSRGEDPVPTTLRRASTPPPPAREHRAAAASQRPGPLSVKRSREEAADAEQQTGPERGAGWRSPDLPQQQALEETGNHTALLKPLLRDPSLKYAENGRLLLRLLTANALLDRHRDKLADAVPSHSLQLVGRFARVCADAWAEFADDLERKA
ncbi:ParB N-terminal domain-containing protein [Streptomyces sp. AV19]|uniref:ParB/RepB/Spo0J family partition protein n=1 Tax=Streptomyces sp. AV19 TaxID=2793068 RepID=UPI0024137B1F|nr:ParB N-terminal domain-containing protein [Streptomyces sp. AV19]MDG4535701.1 ParB N-terminal domain-containing protein [Streptomyces sp. AV19]